MKLTEQEEKEIRDAQHKVADQVASTLIRNLNGVLQNIPDDSADRTTIIKGAMLSVLGVIQNAVDRIVQETKQQQ